MHTQTTLVTENRSQYINQNSSNQLKSELRIFWDLNAIMEKKLEL